MRQNLGKRIGKGIGKASPVLLVCKLFLVLSFGSAVSAYASTSPLQANMLSMIKPLLAQQTELEAQIEKLDLERKEAYTIEQFREIEKKLDSVNRTLAEIQMKLRVLGQGIDRLPDELEAVALADQELDSLFGEDNIANQSVNELIDEELAEEGLTEEELLEQQMAESFAAESAKAQSGLLTDDTEIHHDSEQPEAPIEDSLVSFSREIGDEEMTALLTSNSSDSSESQEQSTGNNTVTEEDYDEWGDVDDVSAVESNAAWQARQQIAQASAAKAAQARGNVNSQFGVIAEERARKRAELGEGLQAIAQGMQQVVVQMEVEKRQSEAAALERRQNAQKAAFQQMVVDKKVARDVAMQQRAQEFAARDAAQQASLDDWNAREAARRKRQEQVAVADAEKRRMENTYTSSAAQNNHLVTAEKPKQYAVQQMLCYFPKSTNKCVGIGYGYDKPCRLEVSGKTYFNTLAIKSKRMYVAVGESLYKKMQTYGPGAVIRWGGAPPKQLSRCVVE